ncbi:TIGR02391 family protein [Streptomyces musisoli]|uniref:TIGR02391 family protein n=1 Tax=Streptomyces musisoli TaxID=2802280 RepID=UPI0022A875CA|nr:TIGR02391 family protein [Streptomyces musisoli]
MSRGAGPTGATRRSVRGPLPLAARSAAARRVAAHYGCRQRLPEVRQRLPPPAIPAFSCERLVPLRSDQREQPRRQSADESGLDNSLVGVRLMREAFRPHENGKAGGALADAEAEGGEQTATANLFAGAMGAYKNPASHRTVDFDDPIEAAEIIQFADLLLRQVERAKRRQAAATT